MIGSEDSACGSQGIFGDADGAGGAICWDIVVVDIGEERCRLSMEELLLVKSEKVDLRQYHKSVWEFDRYFEVGELLTTSVSIF